MAVAVGHKVFMGNAEEVTYGTPVAATKWNEIITEGLVMEHLPVVKESLRRVSQSNAFQGLKVVSGSITQEVMYDGYLRLLKHLLGTGGTVELEAVTSWTHTFTPADTLPIGLTLEMARDLQGYRYHGVKLNQGTITIEKGGLLKWTLDTMAEDEEKFSAGAATFPTQRLIKASHIVTLTVGGTALDLDSFTLVINNALTAERHKLGGDITKEPVRDAHREITGEFTKDFETGDVVALYDKFAALTDIAIVMDFTGPALGANFFKFTINVFRAVLNGTVQVTEGPGKVTVTYPFRVLFDESGTREGLQIIVVNSESAI